MAGASGMTGTSLLRRLLDHDPDVTIRAAVHRAEPAVVNERIEVVRGDLRDLDDCRRMAKGCDCAIMAAAYAGGAGYTTASPFEHTRENLVMNRQMLEAFHLEEVKRIIFIGSATIYQSFEGSIREDELDFNKDPHLAYFGFGWAMRFLEKMCWYLHEKFEHEVIIGRAANIFGPRDKFDPSRSNFIPAIIRKAADKLDPFELWGEPDVIRDVIYCDDFAKAVVQLLDADQIKYDCFNLGSGVKTSVGDVAQWALKYTGHEPKEIKWISSGPTTIKYRALDMSQLKAAVGWEPDHTIEEGVARTAQWWLENREGWSR